jgi:glycosyltransferase involved in cell wall biosynthesis
VDRSRVIRVALGSVPKDSGTFSFYRNLRPALAKHSIELLCVSVGRGEAALWSEDFADDGCHALLPKSNSLKKQARCFVDWCRTEHINIVIGLNSAAILSAIPHLPQDVRVVARCANGFAHGYRVTLSGAERLSRIVAISPRLRDELQQNYAANPERLRLIPNGIDSAPFDKVAEQARGLGTRLEIGFLGRLEHVQKGILHLPAIVEALKRHDVPFRLRIAGRGRHEASLRRLLASDVASGRVVFVGALSPGQVPDFLGSADVFAFTSRFEGMPNALLEAMMAGALPVCFNIPGITDFMVEDDRTGLLVAQGDCEGFAMKITQLSRDRGKLKRMQSNAASEARIRFSSEISAEKYAELFSEVMSEVPPPLRPRDWNEFKPEVNFPKTWVSLMPKAAKRLLRNVLDSFLRQ